MDYSIYLLMSVATLGRADSVEETSADVELDEVMSLALQRLREVLEEFVSKAVSPQTSFELEQRLQTELREIGRAGIEWALNRVEPKPADLPRHVEFEAGPYTRLNSKTPQDVATTFGKVRLWRVGYRPTNKTGDPDHLSVGAATGHRSGRQSRFGGAGGLLSGGGGRHAAAHLGAAQAGPRRPLGREEIAGSSRSRGGGDGDGASRSPSGKAAALAGASLEQQGQAQAGAERRSRWDLVFAVPIRKGTIYEVASTGTITVFDRRGKRLGTLYLAYTPESKQGTMSAQLTRLLEDVLRQWQRPLPRLCYVTDAGDNETAYYENVLKRMCHPCTGEKLEWTRVVDFYHASERVWKMAEALFGSGPAAKGWARRMLKLLKKPNGIRRVLNSASVLRGRHRMKRTANAEFDKAYNYLRQRTKFMRYAAYETVGIPHGSGITEAACKTIYTQRLKLSGMRWKKAGAQTILNLRVLLLSGVWVEAHLRILKKVETAKVPTYELPSWKSLKKAA